MCVYMQMCIYGSTHAAIVELFCGYVLTAGRKSRYWRQSAHIVWTTGTEICVLHVFVCRETLLIGLHATSGNS